MNKNKSQPCGELFDEIVNKLRLKPSADLYPSIVEDLKALASDGHAGAARVLAILHLRGRGVLKSQEHGLVWLHRSGDGGHWCAT